MVRSSAVNYYRPLSLNASRYDEIRQRNPAQLKRHNREFKKLRRLLQRKRHVKIVLCVTWSVLRLFHVGHVVQKSTFACLARMAFRLRQRKKDLMLRAHVIISASNMKISLRYWLTTSKNCDKRRAARAARSFFLTQPIKSFRCRVVVVIS